MATKNYKAGTYINKKPRKTRQGKMCPICTRCTDRSFCKHRKNIKLMRKCENCKGCSDKENCDVFYINIQNKITVPVAVDEYTGRQIRKSFSGKTENDAIYNSVKYKKDVEDGTIIPEIKQTIPTIVSITEEFENYKNSIGKTNDNSYITNMQTLDRIKKNSWAFIPIKKVTANQIKDFLQEERDKGQSNSTLKKDTQMLQRAFNIAEEKKYISTNFFKGAYCIETPKSLKKDQKTTAFTPEENMIVLKYLYTHKVSHKYEYLLAFHYGMRIGEILALSIEDINFETGIIHITKTTTKNKKGKVTIGLCPKTADGDRELFITELTKPILEKAIENRYPSKENLLFAKPDGKPYTDNALNSCFKRICEKAGITSRVHNHKLRNNFNTRSVEVGVDYDVLKVNAGHHDIHQTIDTYADPQFEFRKKELQKYVEYVKNNLGNLVNEI